MAVRSAVAVGAAVDDYESHPYLGTSSWLGAHVPLMKTDVFHKIATIPSCASVPPPPVWR
ncbi:hypothetical protein [Variovorax sp. AFSI2.2]|uniref:hypothetical protein n=1 Tax=Variovorax sp. AFSI2.2 TaxID=3384160 RepID=UPI003EBF58FC